MISYNNSTHSKYQVENQQFKQSLPQQQAEIRYYIYQDLQNLINLMYSRKAVLEYFNNEPNHPMITLSNNKIILQLNLSSTIHTDLNQQFANNKELKKTLIEERQNAAQLLKTVLSQQMINNDPLNDQLSKYKQYYEKDRFVLNEFQLQQTKLVPKFDQEVLTQIITAIQKLDSQFDYIRNGQTYNVPTQIDIIRKAEYYKTTTESKLKDNFQYKKNDTQIINIALNGNTADYDENQRGENQQTKQNNQEQVFKNQNTDINSIKINDTKKLLIVFINILNCQDRNYNQENLQKLQTQIQQNFENLKNEIQQQIQSKDYKKIEFYKYANSLLNDGQLQVIFKYHCQFQLFQGYLKQLQIYKTTSTNKELLQKFLNQNNYDFGFLYFIQFVNDKKEIIKDRNWMNMDISKTKTQDDAFIMEFYTIFCKSYGYK